VNITTESEVRRLRERAGVCVECGQDPPCEHLVWASTLLGPRLLPQERAAELEAEAEAFARWMEVQSCEAAHGRKAVYDALKKIEEPAWSPEVQEVLGVAEHRRQVELDEQRRKAEDERLRAEVLRQNPWLTLLPNSGGPAGTFSDEGAASARAALKSLFAPPASSTSRFPLTGTPPDGRRAPSAHSYTKADGTVIEKSAGFASPPLGVSPEGKVRAIVNTTNTVDLQNDRMMPGCFASVIASGSLPKVLLGHDWDLKSWAGRVDQLVELQPGDPQLPASHPIGAGGLLAYMTLNLDVEAGRALFSNLKFQRSVEWSIGMVPGGYRWAEKGVREVIDLEELPEISAVLWGASPGTRTVDVRGVSPIHGNRPGRPRRS
jgi:hypothetical protein